VTLHSVAAVGADSQDLNGQIASLARHHTPTDVAVIVVGSNDTLGLANMSSAVRRLYRAVVDLRAQGAHVIVATCPDLGTLRPLFQPLRFLARRFSRRLAVAQTIVVVRAGGRAVPLGDTLGPIFWRRPKTMFSADHFHPSPLGYARAAAVLFPSVLAAAERGRIPESQRPKSQPLTEARP
jgi:lysophospholipase L1-like esterase